MVESIGIWGVNINVQLMVFVFFALWWFTFAFASRDPDLDVKSKQKDQEYTKSHRVVLSIPIGVLSHLCSLRSISVNDLYTDSYHGGFACSDKLVYSFLVG